METLTVTQARRTLGTYCARALAGEEIGLIWNGRILQLTPVEVTTRKSGPYTAGALAHWLRNHRLDPAEADAMAREAARTKRRLGPARSKWK